MGRPGSRPGDERGVAPSSPAALLSAAAVVLAGAAFVVTGQQRAPEAIAANAPAAAVARPTATAPRPVIEKKEGRRDRSRPPVRRDQVYVEVYNNSGISGLAGSTAARARGAGWQVVGSDNWYGTIDTSTVYSPARLRAAARLLARDLGIGRVKSAIAPMRGDRLTVILTADYS